VSDPERTIQVMTSTDPRGPRSEAWFASVAACSSAETGPEFPQASYYRARYYDPSAGRFLSEDPLRFDAGINFYRYVKNNSTNLADPYGLKVSKCCRNTQVNAVVDFFSQLFGLKHCYIKTDTVTAGMGPANNGALPACPIFSKTAVTDHSAEAVSPGDCKDVPGVAEACVNKALKIGSPTGRWTPTNQCNSFANDVLDKCSPCKATQAHLYLLAGLCSEPRPKTGEEQPLWTQESVE
jgi:RHS repeat-associated protein